MNKKKVLIIFKILKKELFVIYANNLVILLQDVLIGKTPLNINKEVNLKSYVIYVNNQDTQHLNVRIKVNFKIKNVQAPKILNTTLYAINVSNQVTLLITVHKAKVKHQEIVQANEKQFASNVNNQVIFQEIAQTVRPNKEEIGNSVIIENEVKEVKEE